MGIGHRLHLRLFIEGVEIPVIAADVQSVTGSAAVAAVQIPANDYAMDLRPRSIVHLFAYDYFGGNIGERVSVRQEGLTVQERAGIPDDEVAIRPAKKLENSQDFSLSDLQNQNYGLLFGGELMGISLQKTPTRRGIVLQCADFSSYWDIALQYMVSGYSLGRGGIRARFSNYNTTLFRDFFRGSGDVIAKVMSTAPRSHKHLKGTLLGGLMNLIEAVGGTYYGDKAVMGANDFFSIAEMRLHLTQMVGANPFPSGDEKRLLRARGFNSLFRRNLSGLGKQVSIRAVLQALEKYIFHQVVPITSPRYIPAQLDPNADGFEVISIRQDKKAAKLVTLARSLGIKCNNMIERIEAASARNYSDPSDEAGGLKIELTKMIQQARNAENTARNIGREDATGADEPTYLGLLDVAQAFASSAERFRRVLSISTKGGVVQLPQDGSGNAQRAIKLLKEVRDDLMPKVKRAKRRARVKKTLRQPDPPPRLLQQIYRPDVWMVAPPRNNVLFPELYTQFNYGRDFNAEVTRLLLRTHSALFGSDQFFDGFYFAPNQVRGQRTGKRNRKKVQSTGERPAHVVKDMMEHELYTGVIPTFERMSDLNLHALRRNGTTVIDGMKVGFAQLAANHIFFQYRFRSRRLSLEGKFNPYFALGFPSLVIDKYRPDEELREGTLSIAAENAILEGQAQGEGLNVESVTEAQLEAANARAEELLNDLRAGREDSHYLGTPQSVSHSLNAESGGRTSVGMGYARTTNERTEFLGETKVTSKTVKKVRTVVSRSRMAALSPPKVGMRGPRGGNITEVQDITDEYSSQGGRGKGSRKTGRARESNLKSAITGEKILVGTKLPLFISGRRFTGRSRDQGLKVLVGVEQPVAHYGPQVVALVGTGGDTQLTGQEAQSLLLIRAYKITEEVAVYRRTTVDLPPEDLVFPPWYGEKYRTTQVGSLYSYFFGTGSIVDPLNVGLAESGTQAVDYTNEPAKDDPGITLKDADTISSAGVDEPALVNTDEIVGPDKDSFGSIEEGSTIAEAVSNVVDIYSRVKGSNNADVNEFIRGYVWRPIATATDILGTDDLEIDDGGNVVQGIEGFHSRAFGDYDDLRLLVSSDGVSGQSRVLGLRIDGTEAEAAISARLDTRKEKRAKVLKYLHSLLASRGILG